MKFIRSITILVFVGGLMVYSSTQAFSQRADTTKAVISTKGPSSNFTDTLVKQELSPLDISKDRGLYITTSDRKMQLRILGSVRFSALYDMVELYTKNTFNTYYIPISENNQKVPNYYNSLNNSRLGFEVTRKVADKNVFVRLEFDFDGSNGQFRIRHAYGQMDRFIIGQTWSLFSNVSSMPTTVDPNGPTGSVTIRTPQIRYAGKNKKGTNWAVALEYSLPDLNTSVIDTIALSTVQMIPDLSGRIEKQGIFGAIQLSVIITTITIKDAQSKISNSFGFGGSLSGTIDFSEKHKLLYQITYGKSISHFITTFEGTGQDAVYNPDNGDFESLYTMSGFLSYGIDFTEKISTHVSFGSANIFNRSFQPDNAYRNSLSASVDAFWRVIEGARVGLEYAFGQRWDKDGSSGQASRVWVLFYYDF